MSKHAAPNQAVTVQGLCMRRLPLLEQEVVSLRYDAARVPQLEGCLANREADMARLIAEVRMPILATPVTVKAQASP